MEVKLALVVLGRRHIAMTDSNSKAAMDGDRNNAMQLAALIQRQ